MKFYVVIYDAFIISFIFDIFCLYTFSPCIFYCFKIRILIFFFFNMNSIHAFKYLCSVSFFFYLFPQFPIFFNVLFFYQQFFSIVAQFCFLKTFPKLFYLLPEFFSTLFSIFYLVEFLYFFH